MIEWFARNGIAANLLMVLILALGIHALFSRLPLEFFPDMAAEVVTISMPFRGATPVEVEEGIVVRIEEAISDLTGIERIISNANEGSASIRIEIEKGYEPRTLLDDIKNRVDAISTFPTEADRPDYSIPQHRAGVISVVLSADLPDRSLRALGERTRDDLLALPGVSQVDLMGVSPYEIAIEVSRFTLERFGLGFDAIVDAVRNASKDYPAGSLKTRRGEILLRTEGQAYTGADFGRIPIIRRADGTRLTLADIAEIKDGFVEDPVYARFNGRPAVLLKVYRTHDQGTISLARAVRHYVIEVEQHMPPGISIDFQFDNAREIAIWLDILLDNAIQGGIIILLFLAVFVHPSVAVWVFVGIPISFMGALALMPALGSTINIITLFAFILVFGIVVDDAIVTGENIYTHLKRGGDPTLAAIRGTHEIAVPVTFGILTTITAFVPLLLMEGTGVIFDQAVMVVILVLFFSLVESKLILPAHMKHIRLAAGNATDSGYSRSWLMRTQDRMTDSLTRAVRIFYQPLLLLALKNRFLVVSLFVGFSFVLISFIFSGRYDFIFFPRIEGQIAWATLTMPAGTSGEVTDRHLAHITEAERPVAVTNAELVHEWRRATGSISGIRELGFYFDNQQTVDPIDIQLMGNDFDDLAAAAMEIRKRLAQYPGVFDIKDSFDIGKEEITLTLRPEAELRFIRLKRTWSDEEP